MTAKRSASDSLDIRVAHVTPIVDLPDLFLNAGESAQLLLDDFARDDDDVSLLRWSATPLEAGLTVSLNQAVRSLMLTTAEGAAGELRVAFAATDEQGASGLDTMVVSVRPAEEETLPDSSLADSSLADTTDTTDTTGTTGTSGPTRLLRPQSSLSGRVGHPNQFGQPLLLQLRQYLKHLPTLLGLQCLKLACQCREPLAIQGLDRVNASLLIHTHSHLPKVPRQSTPDLGRLGRLTPVLTDRRLGRALRLT